MGYALTGCLTALFVILTIVFGSLSCFTVREYNNMLKALQVEGADPKQAVQKFVNSFTCITCLKTFASVMISFKLATAFKDLMWIIIIPFGVIRVPEIYLVYILRNWAKTIKSAEDREPLNYRV